MTQELKDKAITEMMREYFDGDFLDSSSFKSRLSEFWDTASATVKQSLPVETGKQVEQEKKVPEFVIREAERAIHAATNPTGMHTNGQSMARIEASKLALLLRYATAPSKQGSE